MAVMSLMADLGAKAENVIVAQFVRLGVAERVRRLSLLHEEIVATVDDTPTPKNRTAESEREGDVVFPTEKDVSSMRDSYSEGLGRLGQNLLTLIDLGVFANFQKN